MGLIKDIYNKEFYTFFSSSVVQSVPDFDQKKFMKEILSPAFYSMEWKERMKHTTIVLQQFLSKDFSIAANQIQQIIVQLKNDGAKNGSLEYMFFPDFVETYGIDHYKISIKLFAFITQFISCEFAVRPFLLKYETEMLKVMQQWAVHKNASVRRLASEGSRPRLPWAMAIPALKQNPVGVLPILALLVNDSNEVVRRSVANNLNDISKDHPNIVLEFCKKRKNENAQTDALLKHACRTLLKQAHPATLKLFGYASDAVHLKSFEIKTPTLNVGDYLHFSFAILNEMKKSKLVRLEYAIYYQKQSGKLAKKVYKISERIYGPQEIILVDRKQSFKQITTRKFHKGLHQLSIIVNGEEKGMMDFHLLKI